MSQAEDCEGIDDGEKNELFPFSYEQSAAETSPDYEPARRSCNVSELVMTPKSVKQGQAKHVDRLPFMESHASLFHAIRSITKSIRQFGEHEGGITLKVTKRRHIDLGASQEEVVIKEDLDLAQDSQDKDSLNSDLLYPVMVTDSQDRELAEDSKDHDLQDSDLTKDSQETDLAKDSQDLDVRDSESTKDSQDLDARDSESTKDSHGADLDKESQDRDLTKDSGSPELAQDSWDPYTWVLELAQDSWDPDSWNPGLAKGSWDVDSWNPDLIKAFLDSDSSSTKDSQDSDWAKDSQDSNSQGPDLTEDSQDSDLAKDSQDPDSWDPDSTKDSQDLDLAKESLDPDLAKDSQEAKDTSVPVPSGQSKLKSKSVISGTQQKRYLIELPPAHLLPYLVLIKRVMSLPISAIQKQCLSGEILCRIQYFTLKLQKKKPPSRPALAEQPTHRLPTVRETGYVTFDCLKDLQWKLYKGIAKRKPKTIGVERKLSYSYGVTGTTFARFTEYVLPLIPKGWIVDDSLKFSENMVVLFAQNQDFS
nr:uncharacterized protein LOC118076959 [Zootoca vivipara]